MTNVNISQPDMQFTSHFPHASLCTVLVQLYLFLSAANWS